MANRHAHTLRVINEPGSIRLEIDGEEFPFFTRDGYHLNVSRVGGAGVTLTIAAHRVEVVDCALEPRERVNPATGDHVVENRVDDSPMPTHVVAVQPDRSTLARGADNVRAFHDDLIGRR